MAAIEVTEATFDTHVLQADLPVLVDFWGDDCVKCQALAPVIEKLADELAGKVQVVKMWLHPEMATVQRYQIMGIPTLMLFKNGLPVARAADTLQRQAILDTFRSYLEIGD